MQIYSFLISFFLVFAAFSQNIVEKSVYTFQKDPVNKKGTISFLAIDLQTGEKIAELNPNKAITCASTTKLFSTATAIEVLGKDKRTQTRFYYSGELNSKGELLGDIWIRGGGDVSLGSKYFSKESKELEFLNSWADSLQKRGIKKIKGSVIADGSEFGYNGTPNGWHEGDIGNYYGAFAAGLNFYDNTIKMFFKTGSVGSKTQLVDIFPNVPGLSISNSVVSAKVGGDDSSIQGVAYSLNRKITGRLPANRDRFTVKGSMPDPESLLAHEFVRVLKAKGIEVSGGDKAFRLSKIQKANYDELKFLFAQESKTVQEIAYWTNVKSVNLFAEGLLNWLGYNSNGDGSTESGLKVVREYWKGKINDAGLVLNDGSGLSRQNAISAQHFCDLLKYMTTSPNYEIFRSTFPLAGKSGTISTLCKGAAGEGRVNAKSGTLKNIKAFSGYVDSKSGKKIAFALIVNNFSCSSNEITSKMEKVLNALAEY